MLPGLMELEERIPRTHMQHRHVGHPIGGWHESRRTFRNSKRKPGYMGMGSLAWRTMYQQGRLPPRGKTEWLQGTSSSGFTASISYSTLLPFEEIASRRMR